MCGFCSVQYCQSFESSERHGNLNGRTFGSHESVEGKTKSEDTHNNLNSS
ncbi:hypothetical protein SynROS8604_00883 [Synechococcus sp. ROS8604]|nr:hypothetical protein SynROS8604_00883 [Synechococcus sp. ROS8604]